MHRTRRDFLRLGVGTSTLLACGGTVPTFLARSATALADSFGQTEGRVLVVVQLNGGNDGLNTVVPYRDDDYRKHRPKIHVPASDVRKIDDRVGFHPALQGFAKLLDDRQLAIVQGVGYPNPNRSHFESMAVWQTARLSPASDTPGWLSRCLGLLPGAARGDARSLHVGHAELPQALVGPEAQVPSLISLEQVRRRLGMPDGPGAREQFAALDLINSQTGGDPDTRLQFIRRTSLITYTSSARLEEVLRKDRGSKVAYPASGLAERLRLIAQLIRAGLTTSIYYIQFGGSGNGAFDTHANQVGTQPGLLAEVGNSLRAFLDDLDKAGDGKRVAVLVFSEFGRRLAENASGGTDHGTAGPVFLAGGRVKPGLHGPYPNLRELVDGDLKHAIDFRQVYATVLDRWLACPSEKILGQKFEHLSVFDTQRG
jgi:uncharacterized protein (DUF1501 family)